jgi:putative copper resistance protein D
VSKNVRWVFLLLLLAAFSGRSFVAQPPLGAAQDSTAGARSQSSAAGDAMSGMPGMSSPTAEAKAASPVPDHPWCVDQTWSTFNHRMAGWFLLLWGLTALVAGLQWPRRTWVRFAPPMVLFGLAEFLFFRNDPEAWPVGPMSFSASLHDPEDLQHRIFLLLVILIALIELLRAADRLPGFLARFGLPILGTFGAVYLFFHKHGGPEMQMAMSNPASTPVTQRAMASMAVVRHEHLWFSIFGFALVAAKLLADAGYIRGRKAVLWSVFAVAMGAYMIGYVE